MPVTAITQLMPEASIRPISDLRTRLSEIESEVKAGTPVIMNRNGKPLMLILDYESAVAEKEAERHRQKVREAEIWDRACGYQRYSLDDVKKALSDDAREFANLKSRGLV